MYLGVIDIQEFKNQLYFFEIFTTRWRKSAKKLPELAEITPVCKNRYKNVINYFIPQYCGVSLSLLGVCWTAHEDS